MEYQPFSTSRRLFEPTPLDIEGFGKNVDRAASQYWQNRTAVDAIEVQLSTLNIDPQYEPIRQDMLQKHKKSIEGIVSGSGFMNGSSEVANMVKSFMTNAQLKAATQNTSELENFKGEAQKLVKEGKYDAEDYDDMTRRATLPSLDKVNGTGTYDVFKPDFAPQKYDLNALYSQILAGYQPDSHTTQGTSLTMSGELPMGDGTTYKIPVAKNTNVTTRFQGNEITKMVDNAVLSTPEAMQYLRHKVAVDYNKSTEYANPVTWRDVDENDPAILTKLAKLKDNALAEVNRTQSSTVVEQLDTTDDYYKRMRNNGGGYFAPTDNVITGRLQLSQFDGEHPDMQAIDKAMGGMWQTASEYSVSNIKALFTNGGTFLGNLFRDDKEDLAYVDAADYRHQEEKQRGLILAQSILKAYNYRGPMNSLNDIQADGAQAVLNSHLKNMKEQNSISKQNVAFLPFAMNPSPDVIATQKALTEDIDQNRASHRYIRLSDMEPANIEEVFNNDGKDDIAAIGVGNTFHHFTQTAGPSFYKPTIANINGVEYLVDNHEGLDKTPQGIVDKMTSVLYSKASLYAGGDGTTVEVPTFIEMKGGIPTEVPMATENSIKFVSARTTVNKGGKMVPAIKFAAYNQQGQAITAPVYFNPQDPQFSQQMWNVNGRPQRVPVETEFLYRVFSPNSSN